MALLRSLALLLGPAAFVALVSMPAPGALSEESWRVAALALFMVIWWIAEAVPVAMTALLPIIVLPLLGVGTVGTAAAPYSNPLIFLFLGGFLLALGIERWNLHRRIALLILVRVGTSPRRVLAGFMIVTALVSMWVSNTAAAAMMLPVGLSLVLLVERNPGTSEAPETTGRFATAIMLSIAYSATVGGIATLIGTPPNALLAAYLGERFGIAVGFAEWMLVGVPLMIVMLAALWLLFVFVLFPLGREPIAGGRATIERELAELGSVTGPEKRVAGVFALTVLLWLARPLLSSLWPGLPLSDPSIALLGGLLLFVVPAGPLRERAFLLDWAFARRLPWHVLLLFGGGLSLAQAIEDSGLAAAIGAGLEGLSGVPTIVVVLAVVAVIVFISEIASNTATAAAFLPVVGALALGLGENPVGLTVAAGLGASLAFMMPVGTPPNAIVYGTGRVRMSQMVRAGFWLNLVGILVIGLIGLGLARAVFGDAGP